MLVKQFLYYEVINITNISIVGRYEEYNCIKS